MVRSANLVNIYTILIYFKFITTSYANLFVDFIL